MFLYGPIWHGALKPDLSTLLTSFLSLNISSICIKIFQCRSSTEETVWCLLESQTLRNVKKTATSIHAHRKEWPRIPGETQTDFIRGTRKNLSVWSKRLNLISNKVRTWRDSDIVVSYLIYIDIHYICCFTCKLFYKTGYIRKCNNIIVNRS